MKKVIRLRDSLLEPQELSANWLERISKAKLGSHVVI